MSELSSEMETENQTCTLKEYRGFLVHCSFPISVVMVLILSFMQRTKKERRTGRSNWFRENFSLIFPVDLYENHDRLAYCLAFGASSSMVLDLLFNDYTAYLFHQEPPGWSKILVGSILTIEISIDCFPTFACITSKSRLLSNAMGFIYNVFWFVMMVLFCISCERAEHNMTTLQIPQIVPQIPVMICLFLLSVYFLVEFIRVFIKRYKGINLTPEEKLMKTHQAIYVRNLLSKSKEV
ncbi:stimulated by retinoic acid gene 6 protein-like [Asterias rubens]|uniref:stimulated by retinoic acid gene 6 protein-like n=1 Tax=Asterias rubens TaxID=7604 RepID=UPI0014559930|nr:stimulated by retinoic acid gene 6 protein-like [Asterias rubens]